VTREENALVGVEEIAACVETWWREERGRRGVRVSSRTIRRWLRRGLPAERVVIGGPWVASRPAVYAWLTQHLVISTGMSAGAPNAPNAH
jgi:hypothetical protein